jgi:hypothetical protein
MNKAGLPPRWTGLLLAAAFAGAPVGAQSASASELVTVSPPPAYDGFVDLHGAQTLGFADYWKPDGTLDRTELWERWLGLSEQVARGG